MHLLFSSHQRSRIRDELGRFSECKYDELQCYIMIQSLQTFILYSFIHSYRQSMRRSGKTSSCHGRNGLQSILVFTYQILIGASYATNSHTDTLTHWCTDAIYVRRYSKESKESSGLHLDKLNWHTMEKKSMRNIQKIFNLYVLFMWLYAGYLHLIDVFK